MSGKYISFDEFKEYYSLTNVIYDRRDNVIYDEGIYIVKKVSNFSSFLLEINFYQYLNHPCIMKIIHYSYNNDKYYFSSLKGEDIHDAYERGKITIAEIASDLLSAITFLHTNGIGHFDIKEHNVVYLNGKATLIDFELSDKCELFKVNISDIETRDYYCKENIGFTADFRDPEFSFGYYYNTVRTDYYALAMTLYDIYHGRDARKEREYIYYPTLKGMDDVLKDFIRLCTIPLSERHEIFNHPIIVRKYDGKVNKRTFDKINLFFNDKAYKFYIISLSWLLEVIITLQAKSDIAFKIVHLFHFMLYEILDDFTSQDEEIQLLAISCVILMFSFSGFDVPYIFAYKICKERYTIQQIERMVFRIHSHLKGILTFDTYYDIAHSFEQLIFLFNETLKGDYNTNIMPDVSHIEGSKSKYVNFITLFNFWKRTYEIKYHKNRISTTNTIFMEDISNPIIFNIKPMRLPPIKYDMYEKDVDEIIRDINFNNYGIVIGGKRYIDDLDDIKREEYITQMKSTPRRRQILKLLQE